MYKDSHVLFINLGENHTKNNNLQHKYRNLVAREVVHVYCIMETDKLVQAHWVASTIGDISDIYTAALPVTYKS